MSEYEKYAEYQDSGVKWLGSVPSHWIVAGFKKYLESTVDYRGKTPEKVDEGVFLVTARNIKNGIIDYSLSQEYVAFKDYDEIMSRGKPVLGDVLFTTEAPLGEVAQIDNMNIALAQRIIKFRGKKDILDNTYLKYFILSREFQDSLMTFATGSTALGIKAERIGYLQQCIPPIIEQTQIANFLDHETAKIDSLIAKQEKLIELLKEKRQAVISHAVTKGLNPDVTMKDSGVEWLGQVPEHWTIPRLKQLIRYGSSISYGIVQPGDALDEGIPFIQTTNISKGSFELEDFQKTSVSIESNYPRSRLEGGEVILGIRASIGAAFVVPINFKGVNLSRGIARIIPNNLLMSDFLVWYFKSNAVDQYWGLSKQGSTFSEVSIETVKELNVVIPPLNEQEAISDYLANEFARFEKLINSAVTQKQLLQERRTALISSAVTGKINVTNWQNPNHNNNQANTELGA